VEVFRDPDILEILGRYRRLWAITHASALMGWDTETYMPPGGAEERGVAQAELATLYQELILRDDFTSLVERAAGKEGLNDYERGVIRVLNREISIMRKLPPRLVYELSRAAQDAFQAWRDARAKSDFGLFRPHLEKIVKLNREKADALGYEDHPYDVLLDLHEEGLRVKDVDGLFGYLGHELRSILERVRSDGSCTRESPLDSTKYDQSAMERVNRRILDMLNYPWDRARLDVSPHPFTQGMGVGDVRITTRYEGFDFKRSMFSTVHEFGHALYELQVDRNLRMTPIGGGVSLGIHEGQSRFWENVVGRTRAFAELVKPTLDNELGFTRIYSPDELYRYFVEVRPGTIRTEADELTYNLHIVLRYEIEKELITGELSVDELPRIWNARSEELLGVRPRNDADGVLQDVHWSHGSLGYFPTYTLGNTVAAMMAGAYGGRLDEHVRFGNFEPVREFLREKVHRWGATYAPKELLRRHFGREYDAEALVSYLSSKYSAC
jgi:carboxypeptidase Taq